MAGWALFAAVAAVALAALWRLKFPAVLRNFALAALMLGAAGYAWQGQPALAGQAAVRQADALAIPSELLALRNAVVGRYGTSALYITPSDALMRFGAPAAAATLVQGGINREPRSPALWVQLGLVIATRDRAVSPAASLAFQRAIALAPGDPGPPLLLGLAYVTAGEFEKARTMWVRGLALTPVASPYRRAIIERLVLLDRAIKLR